MSKAIKDMITQTLSARYQGVQDACVVDLTGLDVGRTQQLRRDLSAKAMRLHVVKNALARRAFAGGPLEPLGKELSGPCALVTGGDNIIDVAKTLVHWAKELGHIGLKEAILEGDPNLVTVEALAQMKSKDELVGEIGMLVASPGRALAGCLQGAGGKIAGCLKTLAEREAA